MNTRTEKTEKSLAVYMPVELYEALKASAEKNDRSLNGEARHAIRVYLYAHAQEKAA